MLLQEACGAGCTRDVRLTVPLVVRLEGTNVKRGKQILADSGLTIISADNMGDAAQKVVNVAASKGFLRTGNKINRNHYSETINLHRRS